MDDNHHANRRGSPPLSKVGGSDDSFISFPPTIPLVRNMQRAIILQSNATISKSAKLRQFSSEALKSYNWLLSEREGCSTFMEFHHKTLSACKSKTSFNIQVVCSLIRDAWRKKGNSAKSVCVKFNIPRNGKTFSTKANFFVELGIKPKNRIAVPIKRNKDFQRYFSLVADGWVCKTYGLLPDGQIVAYLNKEKPLLQHKNVLGVDVNSKCFAISVLSSEGKTHYQTYLGKDIWYRRKKLMERRSKLQSLANKGDAKARKYLGRLKHNEYNFVKNRLGEVVREITTLALKFDADIAIENLKRFSRKSKKFNREVFRMPFFKFKEILMSRCFDKEIRLDIVNPYHTSKWCSHCGAVAKAGHSSNYSLFKCSGCGQEVNSDRKASLAIAVKSLLERKHVPNQTCFQLSSRRVPVSGLLFSDESVGSDAVHFNQLSGKPTTFSRW